MSLWCAKLSFVDRVHFGSLGVGVESVEELLHSDSLYCALCHAWAARFGAHDLAHLIVRFRSVPPFLLSSAFPYLGDIFFLPKPMTRPPGSADENTSQEYGKALKDVAYLPRDLFVPWIHGAAFAAERLTEVPSLLDQVFYRELIPDLLLDERTLWRRSSM